jgi:transcriptional regulator with XRE-family HTH domain
MATQALGAYLRRLRIRSGLSQAALVGELAGAVSLRTIGRWENGEVEPYVSELEPLVSRLGGSMLRTILLMINRAITEAEAEHMADRASEDLTPDELAFFSSLSPERRKLFRQFIEAERGHDD